jgi:hypothetical protein
MKRREVFRSFAAVDRLHRLESSTTLPYSLKQTVNACLSLRQLNRDWLDRITFILFLEKVKSNLSPGTYASSRRVIRK